MKNIIFYSVILLSVACTQKTDVKTEAFQTYLSSHYSVSIPKTHTSFVVLPKDAGCSSCKRTTLEYLSKLERSNNTILICAEEFASALPERFPFKVLVDTFGDIDRLNLQTQNVAIIETNNEKIENITPTQPDNIHKILSAHFKK